MRRADWEDSEGRLHAVTLPDNAPDSAVEAGVPIGPPSLTDLRLPKATEVRLHNALFHRGILTERDARLRLQDVQSAIASALRVDVHRVLALYAGAGVNGTVPDGVDSDGAATVARASTSR